MTSKEIIKRVIDRNNPPRIGLDLRTFNDIVYDQPVRLVYPYKLIMHSCGYIDAIVEDLIEIGLDVLQFDQPERYGSANLARKYGDRAAFYCPVDIQRVMATGDRKLIEQTAADMAAAFKKTGGGLIAMDYGAWADIGVEDEWAQWARDVFISQADILKI